MIYSEQQLNDRAFMLEEYATFRGQWLEVNSGLSPSLCPGFDAFLAQKRLDASCQPGIQRGEAIVAEREQFLRSLEPGMS